MNHPFSNHETPSDEILIVSYYEVLIGCYMDECMFVFTHIYDLTLSIFCLIAHDWDDDSCISILKSIKGVASEGADLMFIDIAMGENSPVMDETEAFLDIVMLANCALGARERNLKEFRYLLSEAGYENELVHIPLRTLDSALKVRV